jgi:acyl dehydratase/NAD(P)-dependent dehydrogenase (short-subunit alcohol dehydrogenase family)
MMEPEGGAQAMLATAGKMRTRQTRQFTIADQQWFSLVTGDSNPLHLDPAWASTTFPGALVVHGLHALLWGLDRHFTLRESMQVRFIHATFLKPILVGDELDTESSADGSVLRLLVHGELMAVVRLQKEQAGTVPAVTSALVTHHPGDGVRDRRADELIGLTGAIAVPNRVDELAQAFPAVSDTLAPSALHGLAALSTLVGMECPGLRSLLSEFSVSMVDPQNPGPLVFRVKKYQPAFSRVEMEVSGFGIAGVLAAFAGRRLPSPPQDEDLRALISPTEFTDQQPLVVGASGGLGAITARLLAAGGAHPYLTWSRSRDAAEETARAVVALNGRYQLVQLDVQRPADGLAALTDANWKGDQLYYFASPRIFRRRLELFQYPDLQDFLRTYVNGFYDLVRGVLKMRRGARLTIFYPSSVAVDDLSSDLFEYRSAKLIGEQLCARMQQRNAGLTIKVARLPRIATRQTQTFINARAEAPDRVLLPIIKEVQSAFRSPSLERSAEPLRQSFFPS